MLKKILNLIFHFPRFVSILFVFITKWRERGREWEKNLNSRMIFLRRYFECCTSKKWLMTVCWILFIFCRIFLLFLWAEGKKRDSKCVDGRNNSYNIFFETRHDKNTKVPNFDESSAWECDGEIDAVFPTLWPSRSYTLLSNDWMNELFA